MAEKLKASKAIILYLYIYQIKQRLNNRMI